MYASPSLVPPPRRYQKEFKNQPRALEMLCGLITDLFVDRQVLCHATVMLCSPCAFARTLPALLRAPHVMPPAPCKLVGMCLPTPHLPHLTVVCVLVWLMCGWCVAGAWLVCV